ncbi:MAG: GNAT family N-acetyltransferase, partial [Proteobacteria bacterium]|nr:GNAT family N-acetyltransferase [Pseudomonadota bacterium]
SVDITKAAVETAPLVIAQVNAYMPRVQGDAFIHVKDVDFIIEHDEPILEFENQVSDEIAERIGRYAARIINDGDTIQVGYGSVPNAILSALEGKKHLGVHTELLTDGLVDLIRSGVIDNSQKTISRGKTIAAFCMGSRETYDFLHNNPTIEMRTIDYVNNPRIIARNRNMTAINSALQIDLTGQATAESLGHTFFSGIGGSADFMRGSVLAPGGRSILLLQSTAHDGEISRIVPHLDPGAGVTLGRGDLKYVVTEYGIAYLYGKNIRERAMSLIAIAHPKFRPWLIEEAKKHHFIYPDQAFIPGQRGEYPEHLESVSQTRTGLDLTLRPVKISDEPLIKDFFYSVSESSLYKRFISPIVKMPHHRLQEFVVIDYGKDMAILAVLEAEDMEVIVGIGQYLVLEHQNIAEVAFLVRDDYQDRGIGSELLKYLTFLARRQGLEGFTAEVVMNNEAMIHLFEKMDFDITKKFESNAFRLLMKFKTQPPPA